MLWWLHFHSYVWYAVIIITMAWNLQFRWMIVNVHAYSMAHSPNNPWPTLFIYLPSCGHYANSRGRRIVEQDVIYILTTAGSDSMRSWGGAILRNLRRKCSFFGEKRRKKKTPFFPRKIYGDQAPYRPDISLSTGWRNWFPCYLSGSGCSNVG